MAHTANFTVTQGTDPNSFVLTDTSTDVDPNLTGRKIYLQKVGGTYLVPAGTTTDYIDWPLTDGSTKTLTDILERDLSLSILVEWSSSSPEVGGSYSKLLLHTFTALIEAFYYLLTQLQATNPLLVNDNQYFGNKIKLRVLIDDAENSTTYNDQYLAQLSLDQAYALQQNANIYF